MVSWYPGHMRKGRRAIRENLSLVDVVLEVVDARIPRSGRNSDLSRIIKGKRHLLILNKEDLAEEVVSSLWQQYYRPQKVVLCNARQGKGREELLQSIQTMCRERKALHPPRLLLMGIPNVGKSLLINLLAGRRRVPVGARPGLTRGKQWIKMPEGFHLLDTPGILPPEIQEGRLFPLAVTAAIPLEEVDGVAVALELLKALKEKNKQQLQKRFNLSKWVPDTWELFQSMGEARGFLQSKGEIDEERTAAALVKTFQEGGLGPLTLEYPVEGETSP